MLGAPTRSLTLCFLANSQSKQRTEEGSVAFSAAFSVAHPIQRTILGDWGAVDVVAVLPS
jgi:hypothetical protein